MRFRNLVCSLMAWLFPSILLVIVPVITGSSDQEKNVCRELGFIVNSGLITVKFEGKAATLHNSVNTLLTFYIVTTHP